MASSAAPLALDFREPAYWRLISVADAIPLPQPKPRVVGLPLVDITMPVMNRFDAARRIKHEFPSTLILVVSQFDSAPFAREAVAAGASGYVVKSNASTELIPMLRKTMSQHMRA